MLEFSCASFVLESISWMIRLHIIWMHWTEYLNQTTFLHSRMSSGQGWKPQASLKHISPLRAYASSKSYSFELHFHLIELFSEIHWSFFYVHMTVHHNKFLYNKINQMHQFPKFPPAWNSTCFRQFLCPSSGVYSLYTRHWYVIQVWRQLSKAVFKPVWHIPLLSVQWINSWRWTEELSETCRVSCQNKIVKLVHLVGFIIKTLIIV